MLFATATLDAHEELVVARIEEIRKQLSYAVQYRERFGESAWLVLTNLPASTRNETAVIIDPGPFGQRFWNAVLLIHSLPPT